MDELIEHNPVPPRVLIIVMYGVLGRGDVL